MSEPEATSPGPVAIRVIDLETTGNSFADGGVVEIGWQDVGTDHVSAWRVAPGGPASRLVRPPHGITPATAAIHHIIDEDVADAPAWPEIAQAVLQPGGERPLAALAAHRAGFEQRWCGSFAGGLAWICTWKCALRVWPEAPTHSNQGLRYWRFPDGLDRATGLPAHRAGPDAYVTAHHLRDLLRAAPLADLLRWSAEPALLARVPFGPFRGRRWRELDDDALARLAAPDSGHREDVRFSARHEQARRGWIPPETAAPAAAPDDEQRSLPL